MLSTTHFSDFYVVSVVKFIARLVLYMANIRADY